MPSFKSDYRAVEEGEIGAGGRGRLLAGVAMSVALGGMVLPVLLVLRLTATVGGILLFLEVRGRTVAGGRGREGRVTVTVLCSTHLKEQTSARYRCVDLGTSFLHVCRC